jgi:tRNA pseudouridine13 synthase
MLRNMVIRRIPEDFLVTERLEMKYELGVDASPTVGPEPARYGLYKMRKRSMTTPDAVRTIARELRMSPGRISYGGLKDRHALTVQHITIELDPAHRRSLPETLDLQLGEDSGVAIKSLGYTNTPMTAEAIAANLFRIVIRRCTRADAEMLHGNAGALRDGNGLLLTNYYGSQRFGSARHGQGWVGRSLIDGDYETALKLTLASPARKDSGPLRDFTRLCAEKWGNWSELLEESSSMLPERAAIAALAAGQPFDRAYQALPLFLRELHVDAFSSLLWNGMALELARGLDAEAPERRDDFVQLVFPQPGKVTAAYRQLAMPHLSPRTTLAEPWGEAAKNVLREHKLTLPQLRVAAVELPAQPAGRPAVNEAGRELPPARQPNFDTFTRPLFVTAEKFTMSEPEADEFSRGELAKLEVAFSLPRGSYATVLLRALGQC